MAVPSLKVIPISKVRVDRGERDELADRAFELWLAKAFYNASPRSAFQAAMNRAMTRRDSKRAALPFLVRTKT